MNVPEIARLVPWRSILEEVGADPGRGSRSPCLIHVGNNLTAFSCSDRTGKAHCYSCGWHGDKLDFLQAVSGLDFKNALAQLANIAGVEVGNYRRLSGLELARAKAHRAALAAARDAYDRWQRKKLIALTDEYREFITECEITEIAFHATVRQPTMYDESERSYWTRRLAALYDRLAVLEHDLDVLTYNRLEAERFSWWQEEGKNEQLAA